MDITERKITKIAREAEKLVLRTLQEKDVGTAEIDLIHALRHNPGCTQAALAELLHADKAAIARRTKNLEGKGYLVRRDAPNDRRSQLLYPTEKAEGLKASKAEIEASFYEYLTGVLTSEEAAAFTAALDKLYTASKEESRAGFPHFQKWREAKRTMRKSKTFRPDRIGSYFRMEWLLLALVTASGLIYNVGLLATPWFEGRLAQCLADILGGNETAAQMAVLVLVYIAVTLLVQVARGDVALSHVTFGYGEKPVLEDFSLTVKQGEQVTLVGRTGAGKSTVFKLLLGLYPPQHGTVTIGGVDVAAIPDGQRRTCIRCVEQHISRGPGTVLEQITLNDPQITGEMARNAAKLAGIDDAIQALPEGYDTVCTDGMFSQGEWQLLSIARAAAADPAVLLLDEITANLDAETEERVLDALRQASRGRTVLSFSHRVYESLGGRTVEIKPQTP